MEGRILLFLAIFMSFPPIILASKSPRRQQLLKDAGYAFTVQTQEVEEVWPNHLTLAEIPAFLAKLKSTPFEAESYNSLIITADTTVILGDKVLNKPKSEDEAIAMLSELSGATHTVVSGVQLMYKGQRHLFSEHTKVYFRVLDRSIIEDYVRTYQPLDRAGAYGIQDKIGLIGVTRIEGDYYNVMGLPVCRLTNELHIFLSSINVSV